MRRPAAGAGPLAALLAGALLVGACGEEPKPAPTASHPPGLPASPPAAAPAASGDAAAGNAERGRQVWLAQCVACHHSDPAKDGPLGPAVKGSSRQLLEARVVGAVYPRGYTPKRDSNVMLARPDLAPSIPDLAEFLR